MSSDWGAGDDAPPPPYDEPPPPPPHGQDDENLPPSNIEAEAALLGAMMISNGLISGLSYLNPEDFFEPVHGRIFERMVKLNAEGETANPITLRPYFVTDAALLSLGGTGYLAQLTGSGAAILGAKDFANQIAELRARRDIMELCLESAKAAADTSDGTKPDTLIASISSGLTDIEMNRGLLTMADAGKVADDVLGEWQELEAGAEPTGIYLEDFEDFSAVCGRMDEGDLILLGARPSMGKSSVGFKVAVAAAKAGHGSGILQLEMDKRKTVRRCISDEMWVDGVTSPYSKLIDGKLTTEDWRHAQTARDTLNSIPLVISDPTSLQVERLVGEIQKMKLRLKRKNAEMKLLVVDYLGLFETAKKFSNTSDRISYISRQLKLAAKLTGISIVALVQLSRTLETRDDKRPMLSDLRDSGSLEQDADAVIFLYRDEYYQLRSEPPRSQVEKHHTWETKMLGVKDQLEIYSAKRREGKLQKRLAWFFSDYVAVRPQSFHRMTGGGLFDDGDYPPPPPTPNY